MIAINKDQFGDKSRLQIHPTLVKRGKKHTYLCPAKPLQSLSCKNSALFELEPIEQALYSQLT